MKKIRELRDAIQGLNDMLNENIYVERATRCLNELDVEIEDILKAGRAIIEDCAQTRTKLDKAYTKMDRLQKSRNGIRSRFHDALDENEKLHAQVDQLKLDVERANQIADATMNWAHRNDVLSPDDKSFLAGLHDELQLECGARPDMEWMQRLYKLAGGK